MNTSKLAKQLKKELTRNVKKTAALGLVTVVALWFWAPLMRKWFGGGATGAATTAEANSPAVANTPTPAAPVAATAEPTGPAPPKIVWHELQGRIAKDHHMQTAALVDKTRDPFAATTEELKAIAVVAPPTEKTQTPEQSAEKIVEVTPESLGLTLQGTMVSRQVRRATINGKRYDVGSKVRAEAPAPPPTNEKDQKPLAKSPMLEFEIRSIEARRVILSRGGKQFELVIRNPLLDAEEILSKGDDNLVPASNPQ